MESKKVDKNRINTEVTLLADLKEQYKALTGKEWILKEGHNIDNLYDTHVSRLYGDCVDQGTKVRQLKSEKANESIINGEVKKLLDLKAKYKEASGLDYKPPDPKSVSTASTSSKASSSKMSNEALEIHSKIVEQGNKVRTLKAEKSSKEVSKLYFRITISSTKTPIFLLSWFSTNLFYFQILSFSRFTNFVNENKILNQLSKHKIVETISSLLIQKS